ncbi:pkip-1 [Cryptophlebia peltastica nucleopolyhedrovirus]|uniref:Pkip-1 n=1 Tax=Cryptophlebia peltastica nucleopolyhedrovirus TaxID=2304025 RepID=A0A346RNX6_9ABAC|nr:pkip-1 [Cryptophlebia peltastica nucleopolyhedrovirus]AXS67773.1 pkip-1 [Cryptophlebia peltastica nucleopolyhedrovirus]
MSFDERIISLCSKEKDLRSQYESKVNSFFKNKGMKKSVDILQNELHQLDALIFGYEEQIHFLSTNNNVARQEMVDNVNDLDHLGIDKNFIERMIVDKLDDSLFEIYNTEILNENIIKTFRKHSNKFVKVLCQFDDKRKAYSKKEFNREKNKKNIDENNNLLVELILLKSNLVFHLCTMEKILVNSANKNIIKKIA